MHYKWSNPYDWFVDCLEKDRWTHEELIQIAASFALEAGSDKIQDLFQPEMDEDGYFKKTETISPADKEN